MTTPQTEAQGGRQVSSEVLVCAAQRYVVLTENDYLIDQEELRHLRNRVSFLEEHEAELRETVRNVCDRPGGCI
jgi:hypothetical protein